MGGNILNISGKFTFLPRRIQIALKGAGFNQGETRNLVYSAVHSGVYYDLIHRAGNYCIHPRVVVCRLVQSDSSLSKMAASGSQTGAE